MLKTPNLSLVDILRTSETEILAEWMALQTAADTYRPDLITEAELYEESRKFLVLVGLVLSEGEGGQHWKDLHRFLADLSRSRAVAGFSPAETARFVFSLKQPLFSRLQRTAEGDLLADDTNLWVANLLLDRLGIYTMETFVKGREEIILRQQQEMLELSTPVVQLWEGILALPLIGTLDSVRTQVVMENLLQRLVDTGAAIAIIDITGVPVVDTLVAQHLLKTVTAARLMGADCIISGIRPQIAQTIVHLGVSLSDVTTKATLADAFGLAMRNQGLRVAKSA